MQTGEIYDGSWIDNQMTGKGKYSYLNGDIYDEAWKAGVRGQRYFEKPRR